MNYFSPIFNSLFIILSVLKLVRQLVRRLILDQQFTKRTLWLNLKMSLIVVGAIPFLMEKKAKKSQFQLDAHGAITIEPTKKEFKGSESKWFQNRKMNFQKNIISKKIIFSTTKSYSLHCKELQFLSTSAKGSFQTISFGTSLQNCFDFPCTAVFYHIRIVGSYHWLYDSCLDGNESGRSIEKYTGEYITF